jgi:GTPase Era involved in 16S rRNA processing
MPRAVIQKVFDGNSDRIAVISVIGAQSSGKSTLLNFLYGCDFATSEGRCTRGVYGTYFKFTNFKPHNCDGVFLIDTEGLFASLSDKDKQRRLNFDRKLVLFCLSISDIILINTKGNLDN